MGEVIGSVIDVRIARGLWHESSIRSLVPTTRSRRSSNRSRSRCVIDPPRPAAQCRMRAPNSTQIAPLARPR